VTADISFDNGIISRIDRSSKTSLFGLYDLRSLLIANGEHETGEMSNDTLLLPIHSITVMKMAISGQKDLSFSISLLFEKYIFQIDNSPIDNIFNSFLSLLSQWRKSFIGDIRMWDILIQQKDSRLS
jgi:hypothetical protein